MKKLPVYKLKINADENSELQVDYVALVDNPAIEMKWVAFDKQYQFTADKERRLIMSPLMIANMPIYRRDETRGEYYVVFDQSTIQQIIEKFSIKKYHSNVNIMHDPNQTVEGVHLVSHFWVDDTLGIKAPEAFSGISQGSWIGLYKINNDVVWNDFIKTGRVQGLSVEGMFAMGEMVKTDEEILKEIADIVTGQA